MSRVLVKVGGAVSGDAAEEITALADAGHEVVVVHGAGPQISAEMERRGIAVRFVDGRRVTCEDALEVVRDALADVNDVLCAAIGARPCRSSATSSACRRRACRSSATSAARSRRAPELEEALAHGRIPVVAPLAAGPLNVNADDAAAALAVGLGADGSCS